MSCGCGHACVTGLVPGQVVRDVRAAALVPNWDAVANALLRLKSLPLGIAHVAAQEMELFGTAQCAPSHVWSWVPCPACRPPPLLPPHHHHHPHPSTKHWPLVWHPSVHEEVCFKGVGGVFGWE